MNLNEARRRAAIASSWASTSARAVTTTSYPGQFVLDATVYMPEAEKADEGTEAMQDKVREARSESLFPN